MHFILDCTDRVDAPGLRQATRPPHLEWIAELGSKLVLAGPLLDEAGVPTGSLLVIEAKDRAEVEAIAAADPYAKAGLFQSVVITPIRIVVSHPVEA
jgi:uncharacterized protein YciI